MDLSKSNQTDDKTSQEKNTAEVRKSGCRRHERNSISAYNK